MKDKHGNDFTELGEVQLVQLLQWQGRLTSKLYCEVADYVLTSRQPAATPNDVHRVYRGQDLVQIILDWPNLSPAYAPRPSKVEELI